jgi:hypothetical protein
MQVCGHRQRRLRLVRITQAEPQRGQDIRHPPVQVAQRVPLSRADPFGSEPGYQLLMPVAVSLT